MLPVSRTTHALPSPIDFPARIQAALGRLAGRVGACALLPPTARLLLAELVRCLDYKVPTDSIRIRNATLAASLELSVRTIGSLKSALERSGWITRRQVQSRRRGMQVADIWLSPMALDALGFSAPPVDTSGVSSPQARRMRRQPAADAYLIPQPSSKGHQAAPANLAKEHASETPLSESELQHLRRLQSLYGEDLEGMVNEGEGGHHPIQRKLESRLPPDLSLLSQLGLSDAAVYKLMGIAARQKCRLGTVLAVAGRSIAKAKRVYSYVCKLLDSKKNWAALASQASARTAGGDAAGLDDERTTCSPSTELLSPSEAQELASEAHQALRAGYLVNKEEGMAWRLMEGVIEEFSLSSTSHAHGVAALHRPLSSWSATVGGKAAYENLGKRLVRGLSDGSLICCPESDMAALTIAYRGEVARLHADATDGRCVVSVDKTMAWRYEQGRLQQTPVKALSTRNGFLLPWAAQLSKEVERRVARDLAEGRAVVMEEAGLIALGREVQRRNVARRDDAPVGVGTLLRGLLE
jgi:hypothetical protein